MRSKLGDKIRLQHILDSIQEIETYIVGIDLTNFMKNSMMRFACIKQLEIIGEASNHISEETKLKFSNIQWSQIIGMRNVFVHEYFGVDSGLVWEILNGDLPKLKESIIEILDSMN